MSRPLFFSRLWRGRLNRWEQAVAGGVAGLVCGLLFYGAVMLTSTGVRSPDAMTVPEAVLMSGSMGAAFGVFLGARAGVRPLSGDRWETGAFIPEDPAKDWIVAFVWPRAHSNPEMLRALGRELEAWRARQPLVTRIMGLEPLLAGRYPDPNGPTPYVEDPEGELTPCPRRTPDGYGIELRKLKVVDPWLYCPALVWAAEGMTSGEAIESLRRSLTADLVSDIGYSFM